MKKYILCLSLTVCFAYALEECVIQLESGPESVSKQQADVPIVLSDACNRATNLTLPDKTPTFNEMQSSIAELNDEKDELEKKVEDLRKKKSAIPYELKNSLSTVRLTLYDLRLNWAQRTYGIASMGNKGHEYCKSSVITTCIQELKSLIKNRALVVAEPHNMMIDRESKIALLNEELAALDESKKQLDDDLFVWNELVTSLEKQKISELRRLQDLTQIPQPELPASVLSDSVKAVHDDNTDSANKNKYELAHEKKRVFLEQIFGLIGECKAVDTDTYGRKALFDDDNEGDGQNESPEIEKYYSVIGDLLKSTLSQAPYRHESLYVSTMVETQKEYLKLLMLQRINAEATQATVTSLAQLCKMSIQNRERLVQKLRAERDTYEVNYQDLHTPLEDIKLLLARLKVLAGMKLNEWEKPRLERARMREEKEKLSSGE